MKPITKIRVELSSNQTLNPLTELLEISYIGPRGNIKDVLEERFLCEFEPFYRLEKSGTSKIAYFRSEDMDSGWHFVAFVS